MPDPVVTRENPTYDEIYTGGTFTGIQTTVVVRVNGEAITIQSSWNLPEDEQLTAEQWNAQKRTMGPSLVLRAAESTNLEYQIIQTVNAHIAALP